MKSAFIAVDMRNHIGDGHGGTKIHLQREVIGVEKIVRVYPGVDEGTTKIMLDGFNSVEVNHACDSVIGALNMAAGVKSMQTSIGSPDATSDPETPSPEGG